MRRCCSPTPAWSSSRTTSPAPPAPDFPRAVTVQKCLRVSGKHNDLENVGPSPRHHTFFEMLGNFSFGDYFKAGGDRVRLGAGDRSLGPRRRHTSSPRSTSRTTRRRSSGGRSRACPPERIVRCGEKDNFWAMGETGPCGPCSEIYVDRRPDLPQVGWEEGTDSGRYLEIWNLVFMQYERAAGGSTRRRCRSRRSTPAPGSSGWRRCVAGVDSNYDTDLFQPILAGAAALAGTAYGARRRARRLAAGDRRPPARHRLSARRRRHPGERRARLRAAPAAPPGGAPRHAARLRGAVPLPPAADRRRGDGRRLPRARRDPRGLRSDDPGRGGEVPRHRRDRFAAWCRRRSRRPSAPAAASSRASRSSGSTTPTACRSSCCARSPKRRSSRSTKPGFEAAIAGQRERSRAATGDGAALQAVRRPRAGEESRGPDADDVRRL